jgi:hypothetical protein
MKSSGLPSWVSMTRRSSRRGRVAAGAQQRLGRQADEGVAAEALAADHRFQQEGVLAGVLALGQLQVERERGFEIGECFRDQGNTVVALRGQRFEFEFGHAFLRAGRKGRGSGGVFFKKPAGIVHAVRTRRQQSTGSVSPGLPASPQPGLKGAGLVDGVFFGEKHV